MTALSLSSLDLDRVRAVLDRHFHPEEGSSFWIERARKLGLDPRRDVRSLEDLDRFGGLDDRELAGRSVWDFVPRSVRLAGAGLRPVESGGTLGTPKPALFRTDEFEEAFVTPFVRMVEGQAGFPRGAIWVWIGPSGPHAVGKAARAVCSALNSPEPFEVDFDPRWYKAQAPGSSGRRRYLRHVLDQSLSLFRREPIDIVFATPPVLVALGSELPSEIRDRICGLHLAGLPAGPEESARLRESFPRAEILGGYGNSLFGMSPQVPGSPLEEPLYAPHGQRLWYRIAPLGASPATWKGEEVEHGVRGRVIASRFDESFLLVHLFERDSALRLDPISSLAARGFFHEAIGSPLSLPDVPAARLGIY